MADTSGVYEIENLVTGDTYIGSSAHVTLRYRQHLGALSRGTHTNRHLQSSYDKWGESAFTCRVLEECAPDDLFAHEQEMLDYLRPVYNKAAVAGKAPSPLGKHYSVATRALMSANNSGNRISCGRPAEVWTEEQRARVSEKQKGREFTEEHRRNLSLAHIGYTPSAETRRKLSEAAKRQHQRARERA